MEFYICSWAQLLCFGYAAVYSSDGAYSRGIVCVCERVAEWGIGGVEAAGMVWNGVMMRWRRRLGRKDVLGWRPGRYGLCGLYDQGPRGEGSSGSVLSDDFIEGVNKLSVFFQ